MKNILIASAVLFAHVAFAQGEAPANDAIAPVAEAPVAQADTPAQTPAYPVSVVVDDETTTYDLSVIADAENIKGAKAYIDAYADNVQKDEAFKVHEAKALETIRAENRFFGT